MPKQSDVKVYDEPEDLGIKVNTKEGEVWERVVENLEKKSYEVKVQTEIDDMILQHAKKKAAEEQEKLK